MRTVSVRLCDLEKVKLNLGYAGENLHTRFIIDCKKVFDEYPHAAASLSVRPPHGEAYPAVVTRDGDTVIWDITNSDLIYAGSGEGQLSFTADEVVVKKAIFKTAIARSILPTGEIPDPLEDFLTEAGAALTAIPETIDAALEEAKESGEFDGPQGPEGPAGQDGADGRDGYTPQRGVDYWTPADQAAMLQDIAQEKADAIAAIENKGTQQVGLVTDEGTTQKAAVQAKGTEVIESIPSDYSELSSDVSSLKIAITYSIDLSNPDRHLYISSDGAIHSSDAWNAVVISITKGMHQITGVLGTNDTALIGIAFYTSNSLTTSAYISGVAIAENGGTIIATVPQNAICAVVCTRPQSYVGAHASIIYGSRLIDENLIPISQYMTKYEMSVQFEQGSINSSTGEPTSNDKRIRSIDFISVESFSYCVCDGNHRIWYAEYQDSTEAAFIRFVTDGVEDSSKRQRLDYNELRSNAKFIKIVIVNSDSSTAITPSDVTGFVCYANPIGKLIYDNAKDQNEKIDYLNGLASISVDLSNTSSHFYIKANGDKNNSNNWNAVIVENINRFKTITAVLGTNSDVFKNVAFYNSDIVNSGSYISGVTPTNGIQFTVDVPLTAKCAVICTRPNSYANGSVELTYKLGDVDTEVLAELSTISKYTTGTTLSVQFEQGTLSSGTGEESSSQNRIRTVGYIDVDSFNYAICDDNHRMWLYEYGRDYAFIKGTTTGTIKIEYANLDSETKYIRIVVVNEDSTTAITPSSTTGFTCFADTIGRSIASHVEENNLIENLGAYPRPLFTVQDARIGADYTIVGTKFVKFNGSSDDMETTAGNISFKKYENGFDKAPTTGETWLLHYLGHCNTVDYCSENGCLIMGNGSGAYDLPGTIIIIPDFNTILETADPEVPLTLENTNAIVIDCEDYNFGTKFNVLWGEKNGAANNIAYLITATFGKSTSAKDAGDVGTIRKLLLGMGSAELTYGQLISGAASDEFNGTFDILDTFTQDGTAYKDCCQGSCYYKGEIVCAIGHDEMILWRMNLADGKIRRKVYHQYVYESDGTKATNGSSGVCTDGEHIYTGITGVGIWALNI